MTFLEKIERLQGNKQFNDILSVRRSSSTLLYTWSSWYREPITIKLYRTKRITELKWRLVGRLASVKPTGCPRVTAKLAFRVLTHRQHTHYPANDGITALTHHVATCKRWGDGNRLSSEKRHFPRKSSCQWKRERERRKKVEMDINSPEWKLRWL